MSARRNGETEAAEQLDRFVHPVADIEDNMVEGLHAAIISADCMEEQNVAT